MADQTTLGSEPLRMGSTSAAIRPYSMAVALVAVAIIGALGTMKNSLTGTFNKVASSLNNAVASAP